MHVLQTLSLVVGLCLLTYVLFSYEDEEKKVTNWFDATIRALKRNDSSTPTRLHIALRYLITGYEHAIQRAYGLRLFSLRALMSSASFCTALFVLPTAATNLFYPRQPAEAVSRALFFGLAIAAPFLKPRPRLFAYGGLLAASILMLRESTWRFHTVALWVATIAICDSVGVASLRWCFGKASKSAGLRPEVAWAAAAISCPFLCAAVLAQVMDVSVDWRVDDLHVHLRGYSFVAVVMIVPMLTSAFFILVLFLALLLRLLSALLPRALYSLIKFKILEQRKPLVAAALSLILFGSPALAGYIKSAIPNALGG